MFQKVGEAQLFNRSVSRVLQLPFGCTGASDLNPEIAKFKFPVIVMSGRYDINVAPLVTYKIHQAIPGSRFAVFERSGDIPFYEEPKPFVRAAEEFLNAK